MQLIGFMSSPFVRRVAVSAEFLGVGYVQTKISTFRDRDRFRQISPLLKVPTLVCDDGRVLVDSNLIIEYLESLTGRSLAPSGDRARVASLQIIGTALVAMEKGVQLIYETSHRPSEKQHAPWVERLNQQLRAAVDMMDAAVGEGASWLLGSEPYQADISTAVAWRFVKSVAPQSYSEATHPALSRFSARAEALPEFAACSPP